MKRWTKEERQRSEKEQRGHEEKREDGIKQELGYKGNSHRRKQIKQGRRKVGHSIERTVGET